MEKNKPAHTACPHRCIYLPPVDHTECPTCVALDKEGDVE